MLTKRFWAALALAAAALALPAPATADPEQIPPGLESTTTSETGCKEVNIQRASLISQVDPLVPDRYDLFRLSAIGTRVIITTYTCDEIVVNGAPAVGTQPTTVVIGAVQITGRDDKAATGQYILWYGTDNPVLFAHYQRLGLPVSRIHPTIDFSLGETTSDLHWKIAGAGLDYRLDAVGTESTNVTEFPANFYYDGPRGDLHWLFDNTAAVSTASVNADFTQLQPVQNPFLVNSQMICIPTKAPPCDRAATGTSFQYARGSWISNLTLKPHLTLD
jgi:hypothetical protein